MSDTKRDFKRLLTKWKWDDFLYSTLGQWLLVLSTLAWIVFGMNIFVNFVWTRFFSHIRILWVG